MNKPKNQIQITDLLTEAVANATERRELAEITDLSAQENQDINGGLLASPIIFGRIPITTGIIKVNIPSF